MSPLIIIYTLAHEDYSAIVGTIQLPWPLDFMATEFLLMYNAESYTKACYGTSITIHRDGFLELSGWYKQEFCDETVAWMKAFMEPLELCL